MAITTSYEMRWTTDYWCPDEQRFVFCDEPCPDGRAHVRRSKWTKIKVISGATNDEVKEYFLRLVQRRSIGGCRS